MDTNRINSTTKGREETTLMKVGSADMWFRGKTDGRCCRGKGIMVAEKGKIESSTQENTQGKYFSKAIGLEN